MYRILIIEDGQLLLWAIEQYLSKQGYLTFTAQTGEAARRLLEDQNMDLVVSDLLLPDVSGVVMLDEIRRLRPNLPIVVITAGSPTEREVQQVKALAHSVIWKPFEIKLLGELLREILPAYGLAQPGRPRSA